MKRKRYGLRTLSDALLFYNFHTLNSSRALILGASASALFKAPKISS